MNRQIYTNQKTLFKVYKKDWFFIETKIFEYKEINNWCSKNCKFLWISLSIYSYPAEYGFENEEDAVLFILRWG